MLVYKKLSYYLVKPRRHPFVLLCYFIPAIRIAIQTLSSHDDLRLSILPLVAIVCNYRILVDLQRYLATSISLRSWA
jgi:hypothetical protein